MLAIMGISKVYSTDEAFDTSPTQDLESLWAPLDPRTKIGLIDLTDMV